MSMDHWVEKQVRERGGVDPMEVPTGPRETGVVEHLVIEARHASETDEERNWATPKTEAVEKEARRKIEQEGNEPAWE